MNAPLITLHPLANRRSGSRETNIQDLKMVTLATLTNREACASLHSATGSWALSRGRRFFDISISLAALIFLSPVYLGVSFLIWLSSPGPVLLREQRVGRNGIRFMRYSFRSMKLKKSDNGIPVADAADADRESGLRVTVIGTFLRKHGLDKLPQLWNVLRGDMSIIGPSSHSRHYEAAHMPIRPGIITTVVLTVRQNGQSSTEFPKQFAYRDKTQLADIGINRLYACLDWEYIRQSTFRSDTRALWLKATSTVYPVKRISKSRGITILSRNTATSSDSFDENFFSTAPSQMAAHFKLVEQQQVPEEIFPWAVFSYRYRTLKRLLDVGIIFAISPVLILLGAFIALVVRLNSPGPVFYRHERIGRFGGPILVWKFRTMFLHGDQVLEEHFHNHPDAREEWKNSHKLKNDPRITPIGRFLRKTSLDEIPQALNVLAGEMSLIGPRPIVQDEVAKYGDVFPLYTHVKPGISGLWQVSGRCELTYAQRVALDAAYVTDWSFRRDLKILIKTIPVLLGGKGAY